MVDKGGEGELERIADKIVTLAKARKGEHQPYLVSALGIDLGDDLQNLKRLTNKGLNEFIQSHLGDRVTLVRLGAHKNVAAIIVGQIEEADLAEMAAKIPEPAQRFHYRFWAAFSVPLQGEVRLLDSEKFTFKDIDRTDVPEDSLVIEGKRIAAVDASNRDALIKRNIEEWLEENGLPAERFTATKRTRKQPSGAASAALGGNLLDAVLTALDRRQLQSTTLPLDVVQILLRTPLS